MEPQLPTPPHSPEMAPRPIGPEAPSPRSAEIYNGPEKHEIHEQKQLSGDGDGPAQATPAAPPPAPALPVNPIKPAQPVSSSPATAADDDLIEKEWVEKAKKVIAETKHDPYLQKQAVSHLQADYLEKRYGKTVKLPDEA